MNNEILTKIREKMVLNQVDAYLIDNADYHASEYVNPFFEERSYASGFKGSNGKMLVTKDEAFLWTDGRYFLQAEKDLCNSGIKLMKMSTEGYPSLKEYIEQNLIDKTLGFNGKCISSMFVEALNKKISINDDFDAVSEIWTNRPYLNFDKIWPLSIELSGESTSSKIKRLRKSMAEYSANCHILSSLTDIAWLFNLRGNDIDITPVFFGFVIILEKENILFVNRSSLSEEAKEMLEASNVLVRDYGEFFNAIDVIRDRKVLIDKSNLNYSFYKKIEKYNTIVEKTNPTVLFKAIKNSKEIKNNKDVHISDGLAVFRMMNYVKNNVNKIAMDELSVSDKVLEYRKMDPRFFEVSFETISGFNENGAIIHYEPTTETNKKMDKNGLLLVDSGGQYMGGTTDITRTISIGNISEEMKHHYTMVLKAVIGVSSAKFMAGASGQNLDMLARKPFWDEGLDYKHGTGHGVGYMNNVHEGPNGLRWQRVIERSDSASLLPGMVTTIEPGIYLEDKYGIRIENEMLTIKDTSNEFGTFYKFDTITCCPIDLDPVNSKELSRAEKKWLNSYHKNVFKKLSKLVSDEELSSLEYMTRRI